MKTFTINVITALMLLLIFGFASNTHAQLNQKQEDQIKKEITALIDTVMTRFEKLDIEGVMPYYSPDFVAFAPDGRKYSIQQVKESYSKLFNATASYKWTTYNLDFIVITKDIAVIAVDGRNETIWKSGGALIYDPSHYTFALEKIKNEWKVSYHHFSATLVK